MWMYLHKLCDPRPNLIFNLCPYMRSAHPSVSAPSTVYLCLLYLVPGHRLLHTHRHLWKRRASSEGEEGLKNHPWTFQFSCQCSLNNDYLFRSDALLHVHSSVNTNQIQNVDHSWKMYPETTNRPMESSLVGRCLETIYIYFKWTQSLCEFT
jgi:hypothetical protein